MDPVFPLVAFALALFGTRQSLGAGVLAVFAVGYVNGAVRANYLGVLTTFMFDAALFGLYLGWYLFHRRLAAHTWHGTVGRFTLALMLWPTALSLLPVNHPLVQLVALRATVWMLPLVLIARRLSAADLRVVATGLVALNLMALGVGVYLFQFGVPSLFPRNAVTEIMYKSQDIAGGHFRIPSTFLSAHAYGGAMVGSLTFLVGRLLAPGAGLLTRGWLTAGILAALAGVFMCGARSPAVVGVITAVIAWAVSGFSLRLGLAIAAIVAAGVYLASADERLGRASTLTDTDMIGQRAAVSANDHFLTLIAAYPLGAGMGSGYGNSIPFFLSSVAPKQIGLENEYARILVDQGWVGLALWLWFVGWLYARPPAGQLDVTLMYAFTLTCWLTAFIGAGLLSSIPGTALMLVQMGVVAAHRRPVAYRPGPARLQAVTA